MDVKKVGRPKLTEEEKREKRENQKKRLLLKLAKIKKTESSEIRKKRTKELIEIGAIISQYTDRKKLLEYLLKVPQYVVLNPENKVVLSSQKPTDGRKFMIYLDPNLSNQ